jgi:Rv0078B-related antitoxin
VENVHPEKARALGRMTPVQRLEAGLRFIEQAREFKAAALRVHNPHWTEEKIRRAVTRWTREGMKSSELY